MARACGDADAASAMGRLWLHLAARPQRHRARTVPAWQHRRRGLPDVALREIEAIFQSLAGGVPSRVSNPVSSSTLILKVQVNLAEVFDLTDLTVAQARLGTHAQELTGDWLGYDMRTHTTRVTGPNGVAPTQELGFELFRSGIEGFRSISAKVPTNKTLTIFPQNLHASSSVTVTDSSGNVVHRLP